MKRIINTLFIPLLSLILIASCSQDNIENESLSQNDQFELNIQNKLLESTTKISNNFLNTGVTEINVTNTAKSIYYTFVDEKSFFLNGKDINLSDYEIVFENDMIHINGDDNLKLSIKDNNPFVVSDSYVGFPDESFYSLKNFNILLLFMNEMVINIELKIDSNEYLYGSIASKGCSFWDTYYVYGTGVSLSTAQAHLESEIEFYSPLTGSCSRIGGSNSGCLWEEYGCVASQAYCCDF